MAPKGTLGSTFYYILLGVKPLAPSGSLVWRHVQHEINEKYTATQNFFRQINLEYLTN